MKRSLTRAEIIRSRQDIQRVFRRGKRIQCNGLSLIIQSNHLDFSRFLFSTVRKFGTAIGRNRAKRLAREAIRLHKQRIKHGYDIAVVLYPGEYTYQDREQEILRALEKFGCVVE